MTPERWQDVKRVVQGALDRAPADRPAFVDRACAGDAALRREADALLAEADPEPAARTGADFFERPAAGAFSPATLGAVAPGGRELRTALADALAGRYEVGGTLGHGGMAVVYHARDLRHARPVALKVLYTDVAAALGPQRFAREIETAANLSHPHVLPLFDSGEADGLLYYVMPYVPGGTLRDRLARDGALPPGGALRVLREVADALDYAHAHGVIHRDVKPENILLAEAGHVLVADFGVARALRWEAPDLTLTGEGTVVGTPAYMSPEQLAARDDVTGASDQYALACVAFELLAGGPAFAGATREIFARRLAGPPPSLALRRPDLPGAAGAVLARALAQDPRARYPHATAFVDALAAALGPGASARTAKMRKRWAWAYSTALGAVAAGTVAVFVARSHAGRTAARSAQSEVEPSVAVLPFRNLNAEQANAPFADGIADDLIARLSRVPGVRVSASRSSSRFRDTAPDVRNVGRRLSATALLLGTVRRTGPRMVVAARLADVASARVVSAQTYEVAPGDLATVPSAIARAVARAIRPRAAAALAGAPDAATPNGDAYLLYLQGRQAWHQRNRAGLLEAVDDFERALAIDPGFAAAHAGLADAYAVLPIYAPLENNVAYERAVAEARRALALDSTLAEAHATLGYVALRRYAWAEAEAELRRATALNPNSATAHQYRGKALAAQGRFAQAEAEFARALVLDPLSAVLRYNEGQVVFYRRQYAPAAQLFGDALRFDSTFYPARLMLGFIDVAQGRPRDALAHFQRAYEQDPSLDNRALLGYGYAVAGARDSARRILSDVRTRAIHAPVSATDVALVHLALGERDSTFAWLRRAREQHDSDLQALVHAPMLDPLRGDPRFARIRRAMHL